MKIKRNIIICVLSSLLFGNSCSFANPVENMARKIKQMYIISYEIKWLVKIDQPYPHSEYNIIFKGEDENTVKSIKNAMNNIIYRGGIASTIVHQKAQGILMLTDKNDKVEQIDISEIGFFVGGNRSENALFYSKELSKIIEDILLKSDYKNSLLLTDDFFEGLSKPGN